MFENRFAITFGEVAIHHVGSKEIGTKLSDGFSTKELLEISQKLNKKNVENKLIKLSDYLPKEFRKENDASVLLIKNGVKYLLKDDEAANNLYQEQLNIEYDKKYFDTRRQKTLNKRARYNIVFGDNDVNPSNDYKKFSIKSFSSLKYLKKIRKKLHKKFGIKAKKLNAEGNKYFEEKSGIGFHGDAERRIVICISLGKSSTLRYRWRLPGSSENQFNPIDLKVEHGDIYIMSKKATGYDWKKRSKVRIVHAAGNKKYINK